MHCGNQKTDTDRRKLRGCGNLAQSDWHRAPKRRGFDRGRKASPTVQGTEKEAEEEEALAIQPIGKEPIQQAREVIFSPLRLGHVVRGKRHCDGLLSFGRSACAFAPASSFLFLHLERINMESRLTVNEYLRMYYCMANNRISTAKRVFILAALSEGTPINAVCRMLGVGKHGVLRVIEETGEALGAYMRKEFRDLPIARLAMDEQWQYVGKHGQRMAKKEKQRGDFWLWAGIDSDTKLVVGFRIGHRDWNTSEQFVEDIAGRITGPVQIATDPHRSYVPHIKAFFGEARLSYSYATEKKIFCDPFVPEDFPKNRKNGIPKIVKADREAVVGNPDLLTATTCHIERFFLTMRQELKRFQRLGLGYSKDLRMHKLATALHIGLYNLVRKHSSLDGQTPAQAAGIEEKRWGLEDVVALTEEHMRRKEDAKFEAAFAAL